MEKIIKAIRQFRRERDWEQFHSPKNLSMALIVECAELAEHFQWLSGEESRNISAHKKMAVKEEIGDVLIYLANLADVLDIDLLEAAQEKIEKNKKKYPAEQARGKSLKYNELK